MAFCGHVVRYVGNKGLDEVKEINGGGMKR